MYNGYRPTTPESPRTVKRDWAFDTVNSSSTRDTFSGEPVNWDDYWRRNVRDDISAPIDKDIRRKVEAEGLQKAKKEAGTGKRLSFSSFIPMDTFRRPSATSSHKSKDEEKDLRREKSHESISPRLPPSIP
ncbi:hypothetical protein ABW19_dt0210400 [Dactylella cylindrospora]|nr:hypothetical protein ABW19_dt0210400 [Dactylella cylindrospora]